MEGDCETARSLSHWRTLGRSSVEDNGGEQRFQQCTYLSLKPLSNTIRIFMSMLDAMTQALPKSMSVIKISDWMSGTRSDSLTLQSKILGVGACAGLGMGI